MRKRDRSQSEPSLSNDEEDSNYRELDPRNIKGNTQRTERAKRSTTINRNYQQDFSVSEESQSDKASQYIYFKGGRVSRVLAQRNRAATDVIEKLCKFQFKSYLHLQWLTDEEAKARDIQMPRVTETMRTTMRNNLQQIRRKYGKEQYFNPSFTRVDRILTRAVLFPIMHHKKGSEMNGKWSEMMMLVCSKLLNYQKDNVPYGVVEKDDYHPEFVHEKSTNKIKVQHIINRVYLDKYKTPELFWKDLGQCIRSLSQSLAEEGAQKDAQVLKQCAIFLYWQWFCLSKQRFLTFLPKIPLYQKIRSDLQNQKCYTSFKFSQFNKDFNFEKQMLSQNIFIRQNYGQIPTEQKQLLPLHPGKFTYDWLRKDNEEMDYAKTTFEHLSPDDIKKLDLNIEVDHLYLIKWCDLDYDQVTWEKESDLKCSEKIQNFKQYSKIPSKKDREKIEENKMYHKTILENMQKGPSRQSDDKVQKYKRKLYHLSQITKQIKQYGGSDIPVYKGYKLLKKFQLDGLNWLIKAWHEKTNCILADEMGLGKTIQTIAFLNYLHVFENVLGPFLIIAPVSTLKQWRNQIQQWSDLNCVLFKGKRQARQLIEQYQFYHKFVTNEGILIKFQKLPRFQVLLTNFEVLTSDIQTFQKIAFQHIIVDEAQKIKNSNTKLAQYLRQLPCPRILLLTGTPIQNSTADIFGLLNFIEPRKFSSLELFKERFGNLKTAEQINQLKQTLKPYMLRRVKSDVEKSIPKLTEMLVNLQLSPVQQHYYNEVVSENKHDLLELRKTALGNVSHCLRQICNHPYMLSDDVRDAIVSKCNTDRQVSDAFINSSIKMTFVHKLLSKCKKEKSKTLIFSQYLDMLYLLREYCIEHDILFEILQGKVKYEQRQNSIDRFNNQEDVLVFIISTKAGGVGINLTSATNIIIYDSDWNPQNDIQAIARAHRIGQHKSVTVYRLVTMLTYEESIYRAAIRKLGMGIAILDNDYFSNQQGLGKSKGKDKSKQEIQRLLQEGIGGFLTGYTKQSIARGQDPNNPNNLQNLSIDDIIAHSCTNVQYQTKDCSFTSTKFEIGDKNNPDAPNFWEVALQAVQSKLQILTKKLKNQQEARRICESLDAQLALMIQANEVVFNFVKSKVSMSHFNAQDERELRIFLEKITQSRQFHKQFKSIANDWLEEIEKPSRRFQKYDVNQLAQIIKSKTQTRRISRMKPKKHEPESMSAEQDISSSKNSQKDDEQGQQLSEQQEKKSMNTSKDKPKEKKKKAMAQKRSQGDMDEQPMSQELPEKPKRQSKAIQKSSENFEQILKDNLPIFLEKPCTLCQRKVCSKICKGRCKRSFHAKCYEYFLEGKQIPICPVKVEQRFNKKQLSDGLAEQFKCTECQNSSAKCFICNRLGLAIPSCWVQRLPKKLVRFSNDPNSRNQIEGVFKNATEEEKSLVYQCRMDYCTKTYHLQCLKKISNQFQFQIFGNIQSRSYPLKCPCHFCFQCRKKLTITKSSCLLCPVSYHSKCKPTDDSNIYQIDHDMFICKKHMSEEEISIRTHEKQQEKSYATLKSVRMEQKKQKKMKKKSSNDEEPAEKQVSEQLATKMERTFKSVEERIKSQSRSD